MRGLLVAIGKILCFVAIWAALLTAVAAIMAVNQSWSRNSLWFAEIGGAISALAALAFMALVVDKRRLASLGFTLDERIVGLLAGTLLGAAMLCAPLGLLVVMGAAQLAPDLGSFSSQGLAFGLLLCFLVVLKQEVLVRSYIFQEVWAKYGAVAALAVTTILFVVLHAPAISQGAQGLVAGANIFLAGVLLGLAYVRTGALWLPIGIHMGWNALQGPVLGAGALTFTDGELRAPWHVFEFSGNPLLMGGESGVQGGLVGLIGPVLGIAVVMLFVKQRATPDFSRAK